MSGDSIEARQMPERTADPLARNIRIVFVLIGMNSVAVQIILLREFISAFQGNELVIGIVMASWMALTGFGAFFGRGEKHFSLRSILLLLSVIPMATIFLLRYLRNVLFTQGSMISLGQATASSLALLAPYCLVSGYAFVASVAAMMMSGTRHRVAFGYAWESTGSVAGGLLFNILLARFFDTFATLALLASADLCALLIIVPPQRWTYPRKIVACLVALSGTTTAFFTLDHLTHLYLFPGQEIVFFKDTPYGNLTVTQHQEQTNFFENNVLAFSTNDATSREENVHYAMVQRSGPKRVLLIGGGISGTIPEVLKYNVEQVDYVEQNPWILDIGRRFSQGLNGPRIRLIPEDGRMFVRTAGNAYDAVLVNLPDPATIQLNRYYSLEFFQEVKRILNRGGILSLGILPGADYQGQRARGVQSVLFATLHEVFPHILIVPGLRNYFIASDSTLDIHITALIEKRKIPTEYVNKYYIDDQLLGIRSNEVRAGIDTQAVVNTDFHPNCYVRQLSYWMGYFGEDPGQWIIAGSVLALAILFWVFRPMGSAVLTAGFAASAVEITLLVAFQALYGSLFEMTGLLITTFMAGLAVGAFVARRYVRVPGPGMVGIVLIVAAATCVLLPGMFLLMGHTGVSSFAGHVVFLTVSFFFASLTAAVFSLASSLRSGNETAVASSLYGLDLMGSAAGALLTSVYVIPALGILRTSVLAGVVSVAGAAMCLTSKR